MKKGRLTYLRKKIKEATNHSERVRIYHIYKDEGGKSTYYDIVGKPNFKKIIERKTKQ